MTCEDLRPDYPSYALGILEDPERLEISEHLGRKCPQCTRGVTSALATVTALSSAVTVIEPSASLRRRISAMVRPEPEQKRSWFAVVMPWAFAGALAIALVSVTVNGWNRVPPNANTAKLEQALSIINDPTTRDVSFGQTQQPSKGRVFVSPSRGVVFIAASLPRLEPGRIFQMWVIPTGGKPVSAGTFQSQPDSSAVYIWNGTVDSSASAVAVTVEPSGGSAQPTTTPFIIAALS